ALRNSFTPITAWRVPGSHAAVLLGGLKVHGASTAKLDLEATWREGTDDPSLPPPTQPVTPDHVGTIKPPTTNPARTPTHPHTPDPGVIYTDASDTGAVGPYIPQVDTVWFSAPFDDLEGVATPGQVAAPQQHFPDTKHRWVAYRAIGSSRFEECFDGANLDFT